MDSERRRSVRIKKSLGFQYLSHVDGQTWVWSLGLLRDISETGMSFTSDKNFLPSQIVNVRIRFPFNPMEWVEFRGRCVNSRGLSIGIYIIRLEFIDLQQEQEKALKDYLGWVLEKNKEINEHK